jgi:hypothetical protein
MNPTYRDIILTTKEAAKAAGYEAMTDPYIIPTEGWMLDNVIADLQRGKIGFALVQIGLSGVEVWR